MEKLPEDEIYLSEKQFKDVWTYSLALRGCSLSEKAELGRNHLSQLPDYFFDNRQRPIYCISLLEWLDKKNLETLFLEQNPIYLSMLSDKKPELYRQFLLNEKKEFYGKKDIRRLYGIPNNDQVVDFIKNHKYGFKLALNDDNKEQWVIPKKIIDAEIKMKMIDSEFNKIQLRTKNIVNAHVLKMKKINEIDSEKTLMILGDEDRYCLEIKQCQDDCVKGRSGNCEFFEVRDTEELRSGCIYVRAHIQNLMDKLRFNFKETGNGFENFVRKQQFRNILNFEARHKYVSLQQPYVKTITERAGKYNTEEILCKTETELVKNDALLQKMWKELSSSQPGGIKKTGFLEDVSQKK